MSFPSDRRVAVQVQPVAESLHGRASLRAIDVQGITAEPAVVSSASPGAHVPFSGYYRWQRWPARNKPVRCFGRVTLLASNHDTLFVTVLLILGLGALFLGGVAQYMHPAILACGIVVALLPFIFLMLTTFTEAGILPRRSLASYPQPHPGSPLPTGHSGPLWPAPTAFIDQQEVPLRWCHTCHIYRPLRASHCRDCDCCVEEFDHRARTSHTRSHCVQDCCMDGVSRICACVPVVQIAPGCAIVWENATTAISSFFSSAW